VTKLLMWHEAAASKLGFSVLNDHLDTELALSSSLAMSEGVVIALITR